MAALEGEVREVKQDVSHWNRTANFTGEESGEVGQYMTMVDKGRGFRKLQ